MLTLAGILGDHPPTDPDGFLAFARSPQFPDIYEAIRDAEPLDDPVGFRFPASVRHRYERLDRFPDGLLVMGDAVASFNPIYGQGMSVAALERSPSAATWSAASSRSPAAGSATSPAWSTCPGTWRPAATWSSPASRPPNRKSRLVSGYIARLHAAAAHDAHLATAFIRVAGLVAPPQTLLRPGVALRVLRASQHPTARHMVASSTRTPTIQAKKYPSPRPRSRGIPRKPPDPRLPGRSTNHILTEEP